MIRGIIRIIKAIQCSFKEKRRLVRQFRTKQKEIYMEGMTETRLNQQLTYILDEMRKDPDINYVRIRFAKEANPYITDALKRVTSGVIECAEENEYILMRDTELL